MHLYEELVDPWEYGTFLIGSWIQLWDKLLSLDSFFCIINVLNFVIHWT